MEERSGEGREEGGNRDRGGGGVHERNDVGREGERYMSRGESTERDTRCVCVCVCVCRVLCVCVCVCVCAACVRGKYMALYL
jgi:hypothetical protein